MKKVMALLIALVMLPSIAAAITYYPYNRKSVEFSYKYYSASNHEDTRSSLSDWKKTDVLGEYTNTIKNGVSIRLREDKITGDIVSLGVAYDFRAGKPFTEQPAYEELFVPAFYRVLRMFSDVPSSDVEPILNKLSIGCIEENGVADTEKTGTFCTRTDYRNMLIEATLTPKKRSVVIFVSYK